jgi:hypothetical protein
MLVLALRDFRKRLLKGQKNQPLRNWCLLSEIHLEFHPAALSSC